MRGSWKVVSGECNNDKQKDEEFEDAAKVWDRMQKREVAILRSQVLTLENRVWG